jgi:beta-phosphoglucomutase-like phosphatase (HAD superfamily)
MSPKPCAVILDMDGLLLDTERVALDTFLDAARELGVGAATQGLFDTFIGKNWTTTQSLLRDAVGTTDALRLVGNWKTAFETRVGSGGIPTKPGAGELLSFLRTTGLPFALATSTGRDMTLNQLTAAGLIGYFDTLATGDEVVHGKPSPDIYLLAAGRLGVDPSACLALEDSPPGVEAAHRAGMRVIMVPDLIAPDPRTADLTERICQDLIEVRTFLQLCLSP